MFVQVLSTLRTASICILRQHDRGMVHSAALMLCYALTDAGAHDATMAFVLFLRFQQWSFGEGGLREIWAQLPEQGQSLFPYLKGAADLLMMPKDLLLDEGIREDMCANLPFSTVVFIANRFQADDFAHDGIPGDVLAALRSEASGAGVDYNRPPDIEVEAEGTYYSPTDDMVMEKVTTATGVCPWGHATAILQTSPDSLCCSWFDVYCNTFAD